MAPFPTGELGCRSDAAPGWLAWLNGQAGPEE